MNNQRMNEQNECKQEENRNRQNQRTKPRQSTQGLKGGRALLVPVQASSQVSMTAVCL